MLLLAGCGSCGAFLAAEEATYDAIAPAHIAYVASDASLSDEQRERRYRTIRGWRRTLDSRRALEDGR